MAAINGIPLPQTILTVSQLTAEIKDLLESAYPEVWVLGEISNVCRSLAGHCYMDLKDSSAQIRAVIWRSLASRLPFPLRDGLEVICRGHIEVYEPRGTYQLIVEQIYPKGIGALELALRQLRDKLAQEGLFDPKRKRSLPRFVHRIALITSPTGAAIRDFLEVLRNRWWSGRLWIVPSRVQGEGAAEEIAAAIRLVNRLAEKPECIVLARGGGSLEDLWAFNEEVLVRAIAASSIPVVTGVGHEIDVTLADLAADVRALTPTHAAMLLAPTKEELLQELQGYQKRLWTCLRHRLSTIRARYAAIASSRVFRRPREHLNTITQKIDELEARLGRALRFRLQGVGEKVRLLAARLESLSPLAVLGRGYSMTWRRADGQLVRDAIQLQPGEELLTRFYRGQATSRVESIHPDAPCSGAPLQEASASQ
ncbi:MAG: exodeoxyribonuclease VII large subunit [Thermoguttaceae bacterium]|nr:exodeoxyribonuclease VII large subunit [Thermoguttaceae bacterium]MDW8038933.1 exodeoxyribonuclease VII large subunit [Thermoguttaceae bacterium]